MPDPQTVGDFPRASSGGTVLDTASPDGGVPTKWESALCGGVPSLSQSHKAARIGGSKVAPSWLWRAVRDMQKHARETWTGPVMRVFPPGGREAVGWGNSVMTGKATSALVGTVPGTNLLAEAGVPAQGGHCHPLLVMPENVPDPSLWFTTLPPPPGHL